MRARFKHLAAVAIGAALTSSLTSSPAFSQVIITWMGPTNGAWLSSSNWNPALVPNSGSIALINNSATSTGLMFSDPTNNGSANQIVGAINFNGSSDNFALGNSSTTTNGSLTLNGAGGLLLQNSAAKLFSIQNNVASGSKSMTLVLAASGNINIAPGGTIAISSTIAESGGARGITMTGGGALELSAANTFSGPISFSGTGSRITATTNAALGSISSVATVSIGNALSFKGDLNYSSAKQIGINGTGIGGKGAIENLTGSTSFAGAVALVSDSSIGATSGTLIVGGTVTGSFNLTKVGDGTLVLAGSSNSFGTGKTLAINSGALAISTSGNFGNATLSLGNALLSYTGNGASMMTAIALAPNASASVEVKNAATFSLSNAAGLSGSGASLTKLGIGTLQISGPASYTGSTTIANGTLRFALGDNRLPTTTSLTLGDSVAGTSATLEMNDRSQTIAALSSATSGSQIVNITGATTPVLTVNQSSGSTSYAGRIGGGASANNLALTKTGPGTLALRGADTYTGPTTVSGGELIITGTHGATGTGAGDYSITANGTIGGTGTISLASGKKFSIAGEIDPGDFSSDDDIGALTINGTTDFSPGGKYTWQFSSMNGLPGDQWDLLQLTTATMSATTLAPFTIEIQSRDATPLPSNLYPMTIATSSSHSFTQDMLAKFAIDAGEVQSDFAKPFTLEIQDNGGALVLVYTPEPGAILPAICAIGAMTTRRRRPQPK